jgi:hypothetical protein
VLVVALAGLGLAHPIAVFSYLLLSGPVAAYIVVTLVARGWQRGWRWGTILGVTGLVALAALTVLAVTATPEVQTVMATRSPQEKVNWLLALAEGFADSTSNFQYWPNALTALGLIAGFVVILRSRSHRWLVVAFVAVDLVYAFCAAQTGFMTWLTGLWYVDRARVGVVLTVLALPLAALGLARLWRALVPGSGALLCLGVLSLAGTVALMGLRVYRYADFAFALESTDQRQRFFGAEELAMIERLPAVTSADYLILGDPNTGAALVYAATGRRVVFGALEGDWNASREYLLAHLTDIRTDPMVCKILEELRIGYLYTDSELYYGSEEYASLTANLDLSNGFELVDQGGTASLYLITGCSNT